MILTVKDLGYDRLIVECENGNGNRKKFDVSRFTDDEDGGNIVFLFFSNGSLVKCQYWSVRHDGYDGYDDYDVWRYEVWRHGTSNIEIVKGGKLTSDTLVMELDDFDWLGVGEMLPKSELEKQE